jgi:hypothetical protein
MQLLASNETYLHVTLGGDYRIRGLQSIIQGEQIRNITEPFTYKMIPSNPIKRIALCQLITGSQAYHILANS